MGVRIPIMKGELLGDILGHARTYLETPQACPLSTYSTLFTRWLGSREVSVLDSGAEAPGSKSQPRRCRVTVLDKLLTPIVPLFTKQRNW